MALEAQAPAASDRDLASIHEARTLARHAKQAQLALAESSQERIDAIVDAMASAARQQAEPLARLAVEETGYGVVADKIQKNLFSAERVHEFIRRIPTVGVVARHPDTGVVDIAEPFGVVAAVVPSTNPTSTAIYKILIALKARCCIVLSPHPAAVRCISQTAEIMERAARDAGAPEHSIGWMRTVTLEGTQELMRHRDVAVILATGGMGLVRAAYSAGKPAYGVGPGNAPAYIEGSADVTKAVRDIVSGKTFDNGVLCSAENAVVVDEAIADAVRQALVAEGAHFLSAVEMDALARSLVTPQRLPNPALVGKSAQYIAEKVGIKVPPSTRVLIAPLEGVGRDFPLSIEKLCPVLAYYVVKDWREGCERCKEILRYGGMGHTMAIHSRNDDIILQFGLKKPAFRIVVNTPTTHGSIGLTTGLDPAMTLGCGGYGGNITSDNISPRHLLNLKRLAYEVRPAVPRVPGRADPVGKPARLGASATAEPRLPRAAAGAGAEPIDAGLLASRIDQFLSSRGFRPAGSPPGHPPPTAASAPEPVTFVCEEDVRLAIREGRRIRLAERAIVTPAARDSGDAARVFLPESWKP